MSDFLPITRAEMKRFGWDYVDFAFIIGDSYVDHPSFAPALLSRTLSAYGFRIGIIPQPDHKNPESVNVFGRPRLGYLICGGNMDSMVNHYTVAKRRRRTDAYTAGGVAGARPDRASIVYSNLVRSRYADSAIIVGGIEASLRRLGHYDYWSDRMRRSLLLDSQADLLVYGMGERALVTIAQALDSGLSISDITYVNGTVYRARSLENVYDCIELPDFEAIRQSPKKYAESFKVQYENTDPFTAHRLAEKYSEHEYIVQNPPQEPLTTQEFDDIYEYDYNYAAHPSYDKQGGVPALAEIKFSLTSNRGCFGACSFCALTFHQGRIVQARSHASLLREAIRLTELPDFKGYIHDVGGPSADFRAPACDKQLTRGVCKNKQCLFPKPCASLKADHSDYVALLRELSALPKVKKVFVRSGIRFDYVMADKSDEFLIELCKNHISGQLRVAPEHISDAVLDLMGKPRHRVYEEFCRRFERINRRVGKEQYVVPYLISSHPGSTLTDAVALSCYLNEHHLNPEQVQDFYPTPSTISTVMYASGIDPRNGKKVYVPRDPHEKAMQRALLQFREPKSRELVEEALVKAGRTDLIGYSPNCLLRPDSGSGKHRGGKR